MQSNEFLNQVNELLKSKQEALAVRLSRIQRYEMAMEAASKLGKQLPNQEQIKSRAAGLSQQAHAFNQLHLLLIDNSLNEDEKLLRLPSILGTISTMVLIDPDYPDQTKRKWIETQQAAIRHSLDLRRKSRHLQIFNWSAISLEK